MMEYPDQPQGGGEVCGPKGITPRGLDSNTPVTSGSPAASPYPPLAHETRIAVDTNCAAWHLGRRPQALRGWASAESGPLRPLRIHGRLAWPVAGLLRVLGAVP